MPWKECHVMDERLRFVARLLEGEKMAPLSHARAWSCPLACFGRLRGTLQDGDKTGARGLAIARLRPVCPTHDDELAVCRHGPAGQCDESVFHIGWQRGRSNVHPQLNGGRFFVDVLVASTRRANEALLYVAIVDHEVFAYPDHRRPATGGSSDDRYTSPPRAVAR